MNLKNVTPDQAHELAMLAASLLGDDGIDLPERMAKAYVAAYMAIKEPVFGGQVVGLPSLDHNDPLHPDYPVKRSSNNAG